MLNLTFYCLIKLSSHNSILIDVYTPYNSQGIALLKSEFNIIDVYLYESNISRWNTI